MTSPTQLKKGLQGAILKLIERDGTLEADATIASLCLQTGFNFKTVKTVIDLMHTAKLIKLEGNTIKKYGA